MITKFISSIHPVLERPIQHQFTTLINIMQLSRLLDGVLGNRVFLPLEEVLLTELLRSGILVMERIPTPWTRNLKSAQSFGLWNIKRLFLDMVTQRMH